MSIRKMHIGMKTTGSWHDLDLLMKWAPWLNIAIPDSDNLGYTVYELVNDYLKDDNAGKIQLAKIGK